MNSEKETNFSILQREVDEGNCDIINAWKEARTNSNNAYNERYAIMNGNRYTNDLNSRETGKLFSVEVYEKCVKFAECQVTCAKASLALYNDWIKSGRGDPFDGSSLGYEIRTNIRSTSIDLEKWTSKLEEAILAN